MKDFGVPDIGRGAVIPDNIQAKTLKDEKEAFREKRERRRFIISLTVSIVSAIGAIIGAVFGILAFLR